MMLGLFKDLGYNKKEGDWISEGDNGEAFGDIAKYGEDLSSYEFRMKRRL